MRVLFISHEDSKFGAPKSLIELVKTLKNKHGIDPVLLLHSQDDLYKICTEENIEKYVVGHRNIVTKKATNFKSSINLVGKTVVYNVAKYISIKRIEQLIDLNTIDIIHTNVSIVDIGLELNKKYNIPHIIHMREPASIVENLHFCRKGYIDYLNKYSTKAIAISNYIKTEWQKRGVHENKIQIIYNGLDFSNIGISQHANNKVRIVFTGALSREKGQLELIKAINMLSNEIKNTIEVDFIGEGNSEYKRQLIDKINEMGLEKIIHLKGYIENVSEKLVNYDIGVVASIGEPFGRVTVEYMAAKLCVIAANTGASSEIIDDAINGYLYEYGNAENLAEKLSSAILNRNMLKSIGENARIKALDRFSTEINAKNIYSLYSRILENNTLTRGK